MSRRKPLKSVRTPRCLSQLDYGEVLRNSHEIKGEALRTIDIDNLVEEYFSRADVTYNAEGSAVAASFYYDTVQQETSITVTADVAGSLNNKYFFLNSALDDNQYYVWYNVGGTGTDPMVAGRTGISIPISFNDSAAIVAIATRIVLNSYSQEFEVKSISDRVIVKNYCFGETTDATAETSGFTINVLTQGESDFIKSITLPYKNNVKYIYNEFEKTFEIVPETIEVIAEVDIQNPDKVDIQNIEITALTANTEVAISIPVNTQYVTIKSRNSQAVTKLAFVTGDIAANKFILVERGRTWTSPENYIDGISGNTIFVEVSKDSTILEVVSWYR